MSGPLPRRVEYSQAILNHIKALAKQAATEGRLSAFRTALASIHISLLTRRLPPEEHPEAFGEAAYSLGNLKLLVSHVVMAPLSVYFAVSLESQQIGESKKFVAVYVMKVNLLSRP